LKILEVYAHTFLSEQYPPFKSLCTKTASKVAHIYAFLQIYSISAFYGRGIWCRSSTLSTTHSMSSSAVRVERNIWRIVLFSIGWL